MSPPRREKLRWVRESASTDPPNARKRRFFRLRVELLDDSHGGLYDGFIDIADEEVTSDNWEAAQRLEENDGHCLCLTYEEAEWVHERLGKLLAATVTNDVRAALDKKKRKR